MDEDAPRPICKPRSLENRLTAPGGRGRLLELPEFQSHLLSTGVGEKVYRSPRDQGEVSASKPFGPTGWNFAPC